MIGNLLGLAQGVLGTQPAQLCKFLSRAENAAGYEVATYDAPRPLRGATIQPIPQKMFQQLGLDWNKNYITVYAPVGLVSVGRDGSGDRIVYSGRTFVCESGVDWQAQAGWAYVVAVQVPA